MVKRKITAQMFEDLYVDIMGGDSDAEQEFRDLAQLLAKRSNQQMLQQERKDVTGEAYRAAQRSLGAESGARFKENNKGMDFDDLRDMVDDMLSFTNSRDYSIIYATESRDQIAKISDSLAAAGINIEDARVTFWMNELFKTGAWKEYKKAHGRSTDLIQAAQEQFAAGKTVDDLLAAYDDYSSGRDDAPDLIESWETFAPGSW